ncbi:VOC family protein [Georgenia sunbinii]|uniref:VOC family protein n=1 Tax=Georgenia sunbinii TaxID=3117728 RepID=UPI002F263EE4
MDRMIFVNLPVGDLLATRTFYRALGFEINEMFSDEHCACVVISPTIYVMALDHSRFADFVTTPIADAHEVSQVINCLSAATRDEVDAFVAAAVANGGAEHRATGMVSEGEAPDGAVMYGRAVTDPDGHVWEILYMSQPSAG